MTGENRSEVETTSASYHQQQHYISLFSKDLSKRRKLGGVYLVQRISTCFVGLRQSSTATETDGSFKFGFLFHSSWTRKTKKKIEKRIIGRFPVSWCVELDIITMPKRYSFTGNAR